MVQRAVSSDEVCSLHLIIYLTHIACINTMPVNTICIKIALLGHASDLIASSPCVVITTGDHF